jgi:hypothetical protein
MKRRCVCAPPLLPGFGSVAHIADWVCGACGRRWRVYTGMSGDASWREVAKPNTDYREQG